MNIFVAYCNPAFITQSIFYAMLSKKVLNFIFPSFSEIKWFWVLVDRRLQMAQFKTIAKNSSSRAFDVFPIRMLPLTTLKINKHVKYL